MALAVVTIFCGCGNSRKYPKYDVVAVGYEWNVYQINDTTLLYVSNHSFQPPRIEYIKKGE